jgi:sugar (pentulose or hexulose) kinase
MPMRWSATHLYQAALDGEEHVKNVDFLTTLSGYVHWKLTGKKALGLDDASGLFPMDKGSFVAEKLEKYNALLKAQVGIDMRLEKLLPDIYSAGEIAGVLTEDGARLLDVSGELEAGAIFCAPEGDAGTGMVATNSVRVGTGNVSAGTSAFAMVVVDKPLSKPYPEIDMITTPDGAHVAMIHVNNCTSEINAWSDTFAQLLSLYGVKTNKGELMTKLFTHSLDSDLDVGGLTAYNFLSGEHVWELEEGRPMIVRNPAGKMSLANLMQAEIYSAVASLRKGADMLSAEGVSIDEICGHGGFFKTPEIGQRAMSAALRAPVTVMKTAGEGGAFGIALLALYCFERSQKQISLPDFLDGIFADTEKTTVAANEEDNMKFEAFMRRYKAGIKVERTAVDAL